MPTSNPLDILLAHDRWATEQTIGACEKLSPEQFARKFDMGPGSLQGTLTHILGAMQTWTDTLLKQTLRPRWDQDGKQYTPAQLREMLAGIGGELAAVAKAHPLEETVSRVREGKEFAFTRGAVICHVTTHGMHHRAQCLNMLKQIGVKPLPLSSVAEWTRFGEPR